MNRFFFSRIAPLLLLASLSAFSLVGCGGDDNNDNDLPGSGIGTGTTSVFAGRKTSTVALSGGRTGTLDFTVDNASRCTGTLTVSGGTATTRQAFSFMAGTYSISGTVDPVTGAFNLTGTIPGSGGFTIAGTLPSPTTGAGGAYTLMANGETYSSNFSPVAIPSPTATPTPVATPSSSGGAATFTVISKSADCNVTESKLTNLVIDSAKLSVASSNTYIFSTALKSSDTSFSLGWVRQNDADGFTPETQTISANPAVGPFGDDFQTSIYTAISMPAGIGVTFGGVSLPGAGFWTPRGGNIVIESIVGKTVVVRGENVRFIPTPAPTNNGTGEFTANFRITYSNVDGL
ncbi:MAG: hypothetical protein H7Y38_06025 [Armatimonadetes bacterium]|nr:hypothetical protein [Armatimonadota bacterium]